MKNPLCPVELGDKYSFVPSAFIEYQGTENKALHAVVKLTGTVVQIHEANRWYRVEAAFPAGVIHECFKF